METRILFAVSGVFMVIGGFFFAHAMMTYEKAHRLLDSLTDLIMRNNEGTEYRRILLWKIVN